MSYLRAVLKQWPLVLALGLAVALLLAERRSVRAERQLADYQAQAKTDLAERATANAAVIEKIATKTAEAVTHYAEREVSDAPIADRVADRVRSQCVRVEPDSAAVAAALRAAAGTDDPEGSGVRNENSADREFAEAAAADLKACTSELNRLRLCKAYIDALPRPAENQ